MTSQRIVTLGALVGTCCLWAAAMVAPPLHAAADGRNTPVRMAELRGSWRQDVPQGRFPQELRFSGSYTGDWQTHAEALPFTLTYYIVEGYKLEIQYYDSAPAGADDGWRKVSKIYDYDLHGDTLVLSLDGKKLTFKRYEPPRVPSAGNGSVLCRTNEVAARFLLFEEDGEQVVRTPWTSQNYNGSSEFYEELKPGRYLLLAACAGKRVAKQEIEIVAGKETPVRATFDGQKCQLQIDAPRPAGTPTNANPLQN